MLRQLVESQDETIARQRSVIHLQNEKIRILRKYVTSAGEEPPPPPPPLPMMVVIGADAGGGEAQPIECKTLDQRGSDKYQLYGKQQQETMLLRGLRDEVEALRRINGLYRDRLCELERMQEGENAKVNSRHCSSAEASKSSPPTTTRKKPRQEE